MKRKDIPKYIVVFDMDETLGHFEQLSIFWMVLTKYYKKYLKKKLIKENLYNLIDSNFNKILRPKIVYIIKYLVDQKKNSICDKIILFTNNPNREWSNQIAGYFSYKLEEPVFDEVIIAYKSKGKVLEENRRQYDKSYVDLLRCTKLNDDTKVCFLDDIRHDDMEHKNVLYLKLKPYQYCYNLEKISLDYYNKNKNEIKNKNEFLKFMQETEEYGYKLFLKGNLEQKVDNIVSKRIRQLLEEFLEGKKKLLYTI